MARNKAMRKVADIRSPALLPLAPETNPRPLVQGIPPRRAGRHTASMLGLLQALEPALAKTPGGKIILFCSARPREGKTTVADEFALALTEGSSPNRVVVIDAGLEHELAQRYDSVCLPLERLVPALPRVSLSDVSGDGDRGVVVTTVTHTNAACRTLLEDAETWTRLRAAFDYVLVEMPSLADSPLALSVARHFDGVVLIIESGRTRWPIVQHAHEQLQHAGASVLGAFLNKRVFHVPKSLYNRL